MKRNKTILISILSVLLLIGLSGCGNQANADDQLVGTWQLASVNDGNSEMSAEDYLKSAGFDKAPTIVFEGGGKATMEMNGQTGETTWKADGNKYTLTDDSGEKPLVLQAEIKDNQFHLKQSGYVLIFTKQ